MELLDIVDEKGQPTGQTVERGLAHTNGIMHRTSHVWLVRKRGDVIEVLVQKRCDTKDSYPGCYDISSAGHIPAGVGFASSAIRELKEELGIDAVEDELIICGDRVIADDACFQGKPFHDRQYSRVFVLWRDISDESFILQSEEVSDVAWMPLDALISAVEKNTLPHCISPGELAMVKNAVGKNVK